MEYVLDVDLTVSLHGSLTLPVPSAASMPDSHVSYHPHYTFRFAHCGQDARAPSFVESSWTASLKNGIFLDIDPTVSLHGSLTLPVRSAIKEPALPIGEFLSACLFLLCVSVAIGFLL